jgi:raffinose/stachyose/melibiose transport system permease protein
MKRKSIGTGSIGLAGRIVSYAVMVLFTALTILPLIWLMYSSFKSNGEIIRNSLALPVKWITTNYPQAWKRGHLGTYFLNSIFYTAVATTLTVLLGIMSGYAFAKLKFRITGFFYAFFAMGLLISVQAVLVPLYFVWTKIGLYNTRLGLIIPYIAFGLPMAVYLGTAFIKGIPDSLSEAAIIDGASYLTIFRRIIFPICSPVVTTITIITFLGNWNEFVFALMLLSKDSLRSLSVGINSFAGILNTNYGLQFAALVIGLVPMILFYLFFHRQLKAGFAEGALKD